jgi:predicted Zn-dependent peptidase
MAKPIPSGGRRSRAWLWAGLLQALTLSSLLAQQVPVIEKTLSNGLRVLLVEREDETTISGGWVAHVGSSNERPGMTGIAHLFEHMMFKGTPTIGTKDAKRDLEIIAEQERIREQMRQEERTLRERLRRGELNEAVAEKTTTNKVFSERTGKREPLVRTSPPDTSAVLLAPENWTPRYRELQKQFQKLVEEQRQLLVKNEFDKIYRSAGASGMNAFTSEDMTVYFVTVPANKIELLLWMESERLLRPVFREFYAERDVVFEERRMRTESTPLGKFEECVNAMFWESHPYHWPVVGWPSDIPAISKAQADEFYATYYAPQNLTLVLVGRFKADALLPQLERYFGRIPRGATEAPDVVTLEMKQVGEKRFNAEAETNPQVDINWHTVGFGHRDSYPLLVLGQVLSTRTGRLYKALVLGSKVATQASAGQNPMKWAGYFNAGGEAREGHTPQEVEAGIYAELDRLKNEDVPSEELQKVKNNFAAGEYRKLTSNMAIFMQLVFNDGRGDWREINDAGAKYQAVSAADLRRVASTYFKPENRTVAIYTRKPGTAKKEKESVE